MFKHSITAINQQIFPMFFSLIFHSFILLFIQMKYIFITFEGLGLPVAYKLYKEGRRVIIGMIEDIRDYVPEEEAESAKEDPEDKIKRLSQYNNILPIESAEKVLKIMEKIENRHEYFVFLEVNNLYRIADKVKRMGFEGNFPTKKDFLFETDRENAKRFVSKNYPKFHIPEIYDFTSVPDALEFLKKSEDIWVIKAKSDGIKTYVPDVKDVDFAKQQLAEMLLSFKSKYESHGFILEKFISNMVELTPEKIYYDGVPLATTLDVENKYIGAGDISVQTGCAQDLVFPTIMTDRINKITFPPIVDEMARKHEGLFIWDASILIDKKDGKLYFGEYCPNRYGYNSFFTELSQLSSAGDFFEKIVHKMSPYTLGTVGSSMRIFNLNRDTETDKVSANLTVDYKKEIEKDVWLWDIKKNERGKMVSLGYSWNLGVITGSGKSVDEAVRTMHKNFDEFSFPGAYCRSKDDYLSLDYPTSIPNRLNYGLERGLYTLPFNVKLGEISGIK